LVIPAKPAAEPTEPHDSDHAPTLPAHDAAPTQLHAQSPRPKSDPVIPLVHAPDDPGPQAEIVEETEAEPDAKPKGWRKIFE
jgi:hypothetical protein